MATCREPDIYFHSLHSTPACVRVWPSLQVPTTCCLSTVLPRCDTLVTPTLYVLNAAALSKPHAIVHLAADLKSASASVAVITETHFKQKHTDSAISIDGYTVFRNRVTKLIRNDKVSYQRKLALGFRRNPKRFYGYVRRTQTVKDKVMGLKKANGQLTVTDQESADVFFATSLMKSLLKKVIGI